MSIQVGSISQRKHKKVMQGMINREMEDINLSLGSLLYMYRYLGEKSNNHD